MGLKGASEGGGKKTIFSVKWNNEDNGSGTVRGATVYLVWRLGWKVCPCRYREEVQRGQAPDSGHRARIWTQESLHLITFISTMLRSVRWSNVHAKLDLDIRLGEVPEGFCQTAG